MQRLYLLGALFIVILGGSLGAFLFVSLLPHFTLVGWITVGVVFVGMGCLVCLMVAFTRNRVAIWAAHRQQEILMSRVVVVGELAAYRGNDGEWEHLSAKHNAAKIAPLQIAAPVVVEEEQDVNIDLVLEYFKNGMTLENIVKYTGLTYYRVQKITSEAKSAKR